MTCMNCGGLLTAGVKFCPRCGTPAPQPDPYAQAYTPPGAPQQQQQQAYSTFDPGAQQQQQQQQYGAPPRRKSRVGKVLLVLFVVLLMLGGGVAAAVYFGYRFVEGKLKDSEAYLLAVQELRRDPKAAEHFGEIRETGFPIGNFQVDAGGAGHAEFSMSVEGAKGSGRYSVTMRRTGGIWSITNAILNTPSGEVVNLKGGLVGLGDPSGAGANSNAATNNARGRANAAAGVGAVSGGVLDGKAISKPAPPYPAVARSVRASGTVTVQVTVDEQGRVTSANAVSGHPLLRAAAVAAARAARLTPTLVSGRPVKVTGVLTYEFSPE